MVTVLAARLHGVLPAVVRVSLDRLVAEPRDVVSGSLRLSVDTGGSPRTGRVATTERICDLPRRQPELRIRFVPAPDRTRSRLLVVRRILSPVVGARGR